MHILSNGVAVTGRTHYAEWVGGPGGLNHEPWIVEQMLPYLKPGDLFVDCGCHIGTVSRGVLDYGCAVVGIEANPDAADCFAHNCPEARLVRAALVSAESGQQTRFIAVGDNAGAAHLSDIGLEVATVTLDTLFESLSDPIKFIKMDLEGSELSALRGGVHTITRHRPVLFIEINEHALLRQGASRADVFSWLKDHNYTWKMVQDDCVEDGPQYDIIALP